MKYVLFKIKIGRGPIIHFEDEENSIYGEVLSMTNFFFRIKVKKTYMMPMFHAKMNENYILVYVRHDEIIREVSEEEYLANMIMNS